MAGITTVAAVLGHAPGVQLDVSGNPTTLTVQSWINARWEEILTVLNRRQLTPPVSGSDGFSALELINRLGAAADLVLAVAIRQSDNSGIQALVKALRADYLRQLDALDQGKLDRQLNPTARQEIPGALMQAVGGAETDPTDTASAGNIFFPRNKVWG